MPALLSGGRLVTPEQVATALASSTATPLVSWTPVLVGTTTPGTHTYDVQSGVAMRIGGCMWFACNILLSAFDVATAGNMRINGLPVASAADGLINTSAIYVNNITLAGGYTQFGTQINASSTQIRLTSFGSNVAAAAIPAASMTNTSLMYITGMYPV